MKNRSGVNNRKILISVLAILVALVLAVPGFAQEFQEFTGTAGSTTPTLIAANGNTAQASGLKIISGGCLNKADDFQDFFRMFDGDSYSSFKFDPKKNTGRCQITFGGPWSSGLQGIHVFSIRMNSPIMIDTINGNQINTTFYSGDEIYLDNSSPTLDFNFTYSGALEFSELTLPNDLIIEITNITPASSASGGIIKFVNITAGQDIRVTGRLSEKTMMSDSGTSAGCVERYKGACKPSITVEIYPLLLHMKDKYGNAAWGQTVANKIDSICSGLRLTQIKFVVGEKISREASQETGNNLLLPLTGENDPAASQGSISQTELAALGLLLSTQAGKDVPLVKDMFQGIDVDNVKWGGDSGFLQAGLGVPALTALSGDADGIWALYLVPIVDVEGGPDLSYALDGYTIAEDHCKKFTSDESFNFNYVLNCVFFSNIKSELDKKRASRLNDDAASLCNNANTDKYVFGLVDAGSVDKTCIKDPLNNNFDIYFFWSTKSADYVVSASMKNEPKVKIRNLDARTINSIIGGKNGADKVCCKTDYKKPADANSICTDYANGARQKAGLLPQEFQKQYLGTFSMNPTTDCIPGTAVQTFDEGVRGDAIKTSSLSINQQGNGKFACCIPKIADIKCGAQTATAGSAAAPPSPQNFEGVFGGTFISTPVSTSAAASTNILTAQASSNMKTPDFSKFSYKNSYFKKQPNVDDDSRCIQNQKVYFSSYTGLLSTKREDVGVATTLCCAEKTIVDINAICKNKGGTVADSCDNQYGKGMLIDVTKMFPNYDEYVYTDTSGASIKSKTCCIAPKNPCDPIAVKSFDDKCLDEAKTLLAKNPKTAKNAFTLAKDWGATPLKRNCLSDPIDQIPDCGGVYCCKIKAPTPAPAKVSSGRSGGAKRYKTPTLRTSGGHALKTYAESPVVELNPLEAISISISENSDDNDLGDVSNLPVGFGVAYAAGTCGPDNVGLCASNCNAFQGNVEQVGTCSGGKVCCAEVEEAPAKAGAGEKCESGYTCTNSLLYCKKGGKYYDDLPNGCKQTTGGTGKICCIPMSKDDKIKYVEQTKGSCAKIMNSNAYTLCTKTKADCATTPAIMTVPYCVSNQGNEVVNGYCCTKDVAAIKAAANAAKANCITEHDFDATCFNAREIDTGACTDIWNTIKGKLTSCSKDTQTGVIGVSAKCIDSVDFIKICVARTTGIGYTEQHCKNLWSKISGGGCLNLGQAGTFMDACRSTRATTSTATRFVSGATVAGGVAICAVGIAASWATFGISALLCGVGGGLAAASTAATYLPALSYGDCKAMYSDMWSAAGGSKTGAKAEAPVVNADPLTAILGAEYEKISQSGEEKKIEKGIVKSAEATSPVPIPVSQPSSSGVGAGQLNVPIGGGVGVGVSPQGTTVSIQAPQNTRVGILGLGSGGILNVLTIPMKIPWFISFFGIASMLKDETSSIKKVDESYVIWQKSVASQCAPSGQGSCGYIPGPKSWRGQDVVALSTGESGSCSYMTAQMPAVQKNATMKVTVIDDNDGIPLPVNITPVITPDGNFSFNFTPSATGNYSIIIEAFGSYAKYSVSLQSSAYGQPNVAVSPPAACVAHGEAKNYTVSIEDTGTKNFDLSYKLSVADEDSMFYNNGILAFYPDTVSISGVPGTGQRKASTTLRIIPGIDTAEGNYNIDLNIVNDTYDVSQTASFNFTIYNYSMPLLTVIGDQYDQKGLAPFTYGLRLKNNDPLACGSRMFYLAREFPAGFSGDFYTIDNKRTGANISAGDTRFYLKVDKPAVTDTGRYKIYATAFSKLPEAFSDKIVKAIAGDDDNLYVSTDSEVGRIDKGTRIFNSIGTGAGFKGIATTRYDDVLFIGQENRIVSTGKGNWSPSIIATGVDARQIDVDDSYVYWVEDSGIKKVSKTASSQDCSGIKCKIINSTAPGSMKDVSVLGLYIYWTEWNNIDNTSIKTASIDGAAISTILDGRPGLQGIFIDDNGNIVTGTRDDRYKRIESQTKRMLYAVTDAKINDVYSDGTNTYWASDKRIERIDSSDDTGVQSSTAELLYTYNIEAPTITVSDQTGLAGSTLAYDIAIKNNAQSTVNFNLIIGALFDSTGWTIDPANIAVSIPTRENRTVRVNVKSSSTAVPGDYLFTISDQKGLIEPRPFIYTVDVHNSPTVVISPKRQDSTTGKNVVYAVAITNKDPAGLGKSTFNLNYNISGMTATATFEGGQSTEISSGGTSTKNLIVTVPQTSLNGEKTIRVKVCITGTTVCSEDSAVVNVLTCGNGICDVEAGESGTISCAPDCTGHDEKIRCNYKIPAYGTTQCDKTTSTNIIFNASLDENLLASKFIACKRGSGIAVCKTGLDANDCGQGKDCLAGTDAKPLVTNTLSMRCLDDNDGNPEYYYLLYYGSSASVGLGEQDIISPNYSYSCPFYNLSGLRTKRNEMTARTTYLSGLLTDVTAQIGRQNYAAVCADTLQYLRSKATSLADNIQNTIDDPSIEKSTSAFNNISAFNSELTSKIDAYCIATGALTITGVVLPGTYRGEHKTIGVNVANTVVPARDFNVIVQCVVDANGELRNYESDCTFIPRSSATLIRTKDFVLDKTGPWTLKNCTPYSYSVDFGKNQCPQGFETKHEFGIYQGSTADVFNVSEVPVTANIDSPSASSVLLGSNLVKATAVTNDNGLPDVRIGFTSGDCNGASFASMNHTQDSNEWTYGWNTLTQTDGRINICSSATYKGVTVYTNTTVVVDNYESALSPSVYTADVTMGGAASFEIKLRNLKISDLFSLSVSENRAWSSSINVTSVTLDADEEASLMLVTSAPEADSGLTNDITVAASSKSGVKTSRFSLRAASSANNPPLVAGSYATPNPVEKGRDVIFTADINVDDNEKIPDARICMTNNRDDCLNDANDYCVLANDVVSDNWACSYNTANIRTGTYNYYVYAEDEIGNYEITGPWSFTVKKPRNVRITEPLGIVRGNVTVKADISVVNPPLVFFSVADNANCNVAYNWAMARTGIANLYQFLWDTRSATNGDHYLCVMAGNGPDDWNSVPITVQNSDFDLTPSQTLGSLRPGNLVYINQTLRNRDSVPVLFTINHDLSIVSAVSSKFTLTKKIGSTIGVSNNPMSISLDPGQSTVIENIIAIPSDAKFGDSMTLKATVSSQDLSKQAVSNIIVGSDNKPPVIGDFSASNTLVSNGGSITFTASGVNDPEGDFISTAKVCTGPFDNCNLLCNLEGTSERSCTAIVNMVPKNYSWYIYLADDKGASSIYGPRTLLVQDAESDQTCAYQWASKCEDNAAACTQGISHGTGDKGICCEQKPVACDTKCKISIDSKVCAYNGDRYLASVFTTWSNGNSARISIGATQSDASSERAVSYIQLVNEGTSQIKAAVYDAAGNELCSAKDSVSCSFRLPDKNTPSGMDSIKIKLAKASTEASGKEAQRVVDDDLSTEWLSNPGMPQWVLLDLGQTSKIRGIGIYSLYAKPGSVKIDTSTNGQDYSTAKAVSDVRYDSNNWAKIMFPDTDARYIKVTIDASDVNASAIQQIEVYPAIIVEQPGGLIGIPIPIIIIIVAAGAAAVIIFVFRDRLSRYLAYLTAR